MLKKILILSGLITVCAQGAYASDFKAVVNPENGNVLAVGKGCEHKASDVFVTVAYPGADTEKLSADTNEISYIKIISSDEYGNFGFIYTLNKIKTGEYQVNINDGCGYSGHRGDFYVSTKQATEDAVSELNAILKISSLKASDYESIIDANKGIFGISFDEEYEESDKEKIWEMMKSGVPYASNTDVFKGFNSAVAITDIVNASNTELPGAVAEYMLFAESEMCELFERLDSKGLTSLYANLNAAELDESTFSEDFRKMLIIEIFNKTDRVMMKDSIEKYADEIGINITANSDFGKLKNPTNVYVGMANNEGFKSYEDIVTFFNELVSTCLEKEKKPSSSQAGSSGGGGGSGASVVIMPAKGEAEKTQEGRTVFKDIEGVLWAKDSIEYLYEKNIVNGVSETEFVPNRNVTREEFVKMIVLAFGVYDETAEVGFSDVKRDSWYAPFVASGVKVGIVNGVGDGSFGVGKFITRQDMTVMLYRVIQNMKLDMEEKALVEFSDASAFEGYAKESIEKLSAMGIVNGVGNGSFAPEAPVTRAMAATVIARIINR